MHQVSLQRAARLLAIAALAVVLLGAAPLQGQQHGDVRGRVIGEGRPVPGATVEIRGPGSLARRMPADSAGSFRFFLLPPGAYSLRARALGFRSAEWTEIRIAAGESRAVTLSLALAPVELERVEVVASGVRIERQGTDYATGLAAEEIQRLPTGYDARDLVAFTPGARAGQVWGGATSQANNYQIDGLAANHPGVGGDLIQPSISWIESIEVRGLGAGAEHGNFQGGLVNVTTKSGSDVLQGAFRTALESHHANASNLGEWDIGSEITGRYDVEGELRGPLLRERVFFFLAGQLIRRDARFVSHLRTESRFLPALEERQEGKYFGKLSWLPTGRDRLDLAVGGIHTRIRHFGMTGFESPEATLDMRAPTRFYSAAWQHSLGSRGSLEARLAGFARDERRDPYLPEEVPAVQLYGIRPPFGIYQNAPLRYRHFPESVSGSTALNLDFSAGGTEHLLKIGGEVSRGSFLDQRRRTGGMTWRPPRLRSFDPADPATWSFSSAALIPTTWGGEVDLSTEVENSAVYAQDYIDLGPRLSISPGVRLGRWRGWMTPAGGSGERFLAVEDVAWDPRIGVTVDLTGKNELVAKAHWGRYHQNLLSQLFDRAGGQGVFTNEELWYYRGPRISDPRRTFTVEERERLAREGLFTLEEEIVLNETGPAVDYRQPYISQWVTGLEKTFGGRVKAEAVYVNRRNRNMVALVDRNRATNFTVYEHVRVLDLGGQAVDFNGDKLLLRRLYIPNNAILAHLRRVAYGGCSDCPLPPGITLADTATLTWDPDYVLTSAPGAQRKFDQLQLSLQASFPDWGASGSVVFTRLAGNYNSVAGYDDPAGFGAGPWVRLNEGVNSYGPLADFSDRELKLAVWGDLPWRLHGGAFWNYATGDFYSPVFTLSVLQQQFRSYEDQVIPGEVVYPLTGHTVFIGQRGKRKHDPRASVDFRLERDFALGRARLAASLEVFNLFNSGTVTEVNPSVNLGKNYYSFLPPSLGGTRNRDPSEYFEAVIGRVPPRTIRLGTSIRF